MQHSCQSSYRRFLSPRVIGSPISQYADDTSLVVCSDDAIRACFEVSDVYERGSGSKLNLSKGLWLGPTAPTRPLLLIGCPSKLRFSGVF